MMKNMEAQGVKQVKKPSHRVGPSSILQPLNPRTNRWQFPPRRAILLLSLVLTFLMASCRSKLPTSTPSLVPPPQSSLSTNSPIPPTVQPSPPNETAIAQETDQALPGPPSPPTQYTLRAQLDYDAHHLTVQEGILYANHTGEELSDLSLVVEPNRYPGGFLLTDISWDDGSGIKDYALEGPQLNLPLRQPLGTGERVGFSISYELNLPQQGAPFGYTERQTNLADWYPFLPAYIPGKGWSIHEAAYLGEHLTYDIADYLVDIHLTNPTSAVGLPLTIAASAISLEQDDWTHYHLENARNFAWSVSDQYQVISMSAGSISIQGYSFPYHPTADEPAVKTAAQALNLFSQLFTPYQHNSLSVVEADFLNGMEYDGMFFLSHAFYDYFTGTSENNLIIISAHETAHQWFFGQVGNDQAMEPWLDEALATYCESLFYEHIYPDKLDWWWQNRVYFHNPEGWVDSTIYNTPGFYPYRDAIYLRGALFMNDLRDLMGDEDFFAFLRDYLHQFRFRQASGDDFFSLLSKHTSADLSGLLSTYFANR